MNAPGIAPKRILAVDDEPAVCEAVKLMLSFDGHQVDMANSAEAALNLFEKGRYDVVITDYSMPVMKGNELAAAIKARVSAQPVILITAYAEMLAASKTPLNGVDFVISKPFLMDDLRAAISKATRSATESNSSESK
jgi:two-component system, NarL family, sensor histidine kinase EvgS